MYSSQARVDTTSLFVLIPSETLRRVLEPLGLSVLNARGVPRGRHAVWLDLGFIRQGAGQARGIDQRAWWEQTGATAGSAMGWAAGAWWGLATGWLRGATPGVESGSSGAELGRSLGAEWGQRLSDSASRVFGTYMETIVAVPNVVSKARRGGPYRFVLAMHTNGPVAVWGDSALRYGYKKRLCRLAGQRFEAYDVNEEGPRPSLRAELAPPAGDAWRRPGALAGLGAALGWLSQPLLGHLRDDRFAISVLERDYPEDEACVAPASGRLLVAPKFVRGLPGGRFDVLPIARSRPHGAFSARDLVTRVTYPETLGLSEL